MQKVQEEKGPKCVACDEGYTAKAGEIMGIYVYSRRLAFREWTSSNGSNQLAPPSQGYSTVTHSNFIHY